MAGAAESAAERQADLLHGQASQSVAAAERGLMAIIQDTRGRFVSEGE
ncbi:hypothetical protein SCAB_76941 [Streptomyces scabiei 87.22]|uniref:Uncharacterized protein n=1 Tax=Streptomyces scabiei (strain 87.22) TaxID=680198 RepID=C9Z9J2_STRSW|nr:hypothetical protein SCAB_76941 [Streptomyces scabiei 87.22]